ncbi:MAG: hypothetical protein E7A62_03595 [Actinomycetaceae bacterium]|nr:hypothetical protein [Actinomycetaceae bacterium]MDU0970069.1 hypothetical protein [Actinomycetaceae bacterium]
MAAIGPTPPGVVTGVHAAAWIGRMARQLADTHQALDALDHAGGLDEQAGTCAWMTARAAAAAVADLHEAGDAAWVLDVAASAALSHAQGAGGIVVAHVLASAASAVADPSLTPVAFAQVLRATAQALPACLVGAASTGGALALMADTILDEVDTSVPELVSTTLAEQAWVAAQSALIEADTEVVDALAAVVVVMLGAAADSDQTDAHSTVAQMLDDLAGGLTAPTPRPGRLRVDFTIEADAATAERMRQRIEARGRGGVMAGLPDPFGFATWVVSARTDTPFAIVTDQCRRVEVYTPTPLELVEPQLDTGVVAFERPGAAMVSPAVIALTQARGIVDEVAMTGAHVCWGPDGWAGDLAAVVDRLAQPVVVIAPAGPKLDALARSVRAQFAGTGTEVLVAPTADDLQVAQVAQSATAKVGAHLAADELARLQRSRIMRALEAVHTVVLDPHVALADVVSEHDRQVRVLLGAEGPGRNQIVAQLEAISPWLRLDIVPGDQPGPTVIGVVES